jgi:hypothetical protein
MGSARRLGARLALEGEDVKTQLLVAFAVLIGVAGCLRTVARADGGSNKPTLDITVQSTFSTGSDESGAPGGEPLTNGATRFPFTLTVPIAKKVSFVFAHTNIDETLGRVTGATGSYIFPGAYDGDANDASLNYSTRGVIFSVGYLQRHRACCPYDEIEEHLAYAGFQDAFGPIMAKESLFVFDLQGLRTVNHKESATFLAANAPGYTLGNYRGNLAIYRTSIETRPPIGNTGFRGLMQAGIDSDYFDYQPIPLYYSYINLGVEKAFSPNVTYTMFVENLTQRQQGYPFVTPNAIHRAKLVLSADFKIPF